MGTLSKALGSYGGYLCASRAVIDLVKTRARTLIYSTGLPPANVAAALAALDIIGAEPELSSRPLANAQAFTRACNLPLAQSAIVPLIIGDELAALFAQEAEQLGEIFEGGAGGVLVGRRGEDGFGAAERGSLLVEELAVIVEAAPLFLQAAEFVLQRLHPLVGRKVEIGGAGGDVEDRGLRRAAAGDLQRLFDQGGWQVGEHDFERAGRGHGDGRGARDDGAIGINGDSGDAGIGVGGAKAEGGRQNPESSGEGKTEGFHRAKFGTYLEE